MKGFVAAMFKIYKYTNKVNGKIYIGQTRNSLSQRAKFNGENYYGCRYFYNAIKKYGWENFEPEIIVDGLTQEEADILEEYFIKQYNSTDRSIGYNISFGGNNNVMPDESKEIISKKAIERYKDKTKNPMYGKKHSETSLKKMSQKKVGKNNPMYGKHLSEESKQKQKETRIKNGTNTGHIWTLEERQVKSIQQKELCKKYINKKVYCIEDDLHFDSITEAAKFYNVGVSTLAACLRGRQKTCRKRHFLYDK